MKRYLIVIAAGLLLATGIGPAFVRAQTVENLKQELLAAVRQQMESARNPGLSSRFFSVGDPDRLLPVVDQYVLGVAVDPDYLAHARTSKYLLSFLWTQNAIRGLAQPREEDAPWADIAVTPREGRYSGWIILAEPPDANEAARMTAFHEAIHAYHLHLGSDVDADEYGGPENVSNTLWSLLFSLRKIDNELQTILQKIRAGRPYAADVKKLESRLAIQARIYHSIDKPQFREVLRNIGGRAEWDDYEAAIRQAILDAEAVAPDSVAQFEAQIGALEEEVVTVEQAFTAFREQLLRYQEDEAIFFLHARAAVTGKDRAISAMDTMLAVLPNVGEYLQAVEAATGSLSADTAKLEGLYRMAAEGSRKVTEVVTATCEYESRLGTEPSPTRGQLEQWLEETGSGLEAAAYGSNDMGLQIDTVLMSFDAQTSRLETLVQQLGNALSRLDATTGANVFPRFEDIARQLEEASKDLGAARELEAKLLNEMVQMSAKRSQIRNTTKQLDTRASDLLDFVRDVDGRLEAEVVALQKRARSIETGLDIELGTRLPQAPDIGEEILQARRTLETADPAVFQASLARGREILRRGREALSDAEAVRVSGAFAIRNVPAEIRRGQACYASLQAARDEAEDMPPQLLADFRGALEACDFIRAGDLLAQMPPASVKGEAQNNYQSAIELEKKLEGYVATANRQYKAGDYQNAATTLESALAEASCTRHIESLEKKLAMVEGRMAQALYSRAEAAIEACEYGTARDLIDGLADGDRKSALRERYRTDITLQQRLQDRVAKANGEYKRGEYQLALGTLRSALAEAECERHIASLNDKIAIVEGKLNTSPAQQVANHDCSVYANSHAEWDQNRNAPICKCDSGFAPNEDRDACVMTPETRLARHRCNVTNSHAEWDENRGAPVCKCDPGFKARGNACIRVAAGPPECPQGRIWLVGENRCVGASWCQQNISGSIAEWNGRGYRCNCPVDKTLVSNADGRACVSRW